MKYSLYATQPIAFLPSVRGKPLRQKVHHCSRHLCVSQSHAAGNAKLTAQFVAAAERLFLHVFHQRQHLLAAAQAVFACIDALLTFEKSLAANPTSAALVAAMKKSYPQLTEGAMSLDNGAKVNTGEMKW